MEWDVVVGLEGEDAPSKLLKSTGFAETLPSLLLESA